MTAHDDLARAAAERRYPPYLDGSERAGVRARLRAAFEAGFRSAVAEGPPFAPGERVFYSGPVVNPEWERGREGTVLAVHQTIDVQWDHGVTNYQMPSSEFTTVGADRAPGEAHS